MKTFFPLLLLGGLCLGMLQAGEAQAGNQRHWPLDLNDDGKITMSEIMRALKPRIRQGFKALDRNHDGVLSDKDLDDVREGMERIRRWLDRLLRDVLPDFPPSPRQHQEQKEVMLRIHDA